MSVQTSEPETCHHDARFSCNICFEAVVEPVVPHCGHLFCWPCLYKWMEPGLERNERTNLGLLPSTSINRSRRMCPVCKSPCSIDHLVPIYVRSDEIVRNPRDQEEVAGSERKECDGSSQNQSSTADALHHNNAHSENMPSSGTSENSDVGLRQRRVPSRPAASSPSRQSPNRDSQRDTSMISTSPNGHRASLSHGIMLTFQQATSPSIPSLHRRAMADNAELDAHPNATEYLSRLLIMLTSFVILCLLLL